MNNQRTTLAMPRIAPTLPNVVFGLHASGCTKWVSSVAEREQLNAALGALRAEDSFEADTL